MENIIIAVMQRIAEGMPELSLVDEYYGQLETEEDTYPVTFPCVLIDPPKGQWENVSPGTQKGDIEMTVMLAIDCYDDTHYSSGTEEKITERLLQVKKLYKLLQGFRIDRRMGPMFRKKSNNYTLAGGKKIYEIIFGFKFHDESAAIDQ